MGALSALEKAWLEHWLSPGELVLGWIAIAKSPVDSSYKSRLSRPPAHFLLTDRRMALVGLSVLGEENVRVLPRAALRLERFGRNARVRVEENEWVVRAKNARLQAELAEATGLLPPQRLREVARLNWVRSDIDPVRAFVERALAYSAAQDDPLAMAATVFLKLEAASPPGATELTLLVHALKRDSLPAVCLSDVWSEWQISATSGQALVRLLRTQDAEPWALCLHQSIYRTKRSENPVLQLENAVELGEHLSSIPQPSFARALLEQYVREHEGDLTFMAPPSHEEGLLTRLYETLTLSARVGATPKHGSLQRLLQLRPFEATRAERLAENAPEPLASRARTLASLLKPGGALKVAVATHAAPAAALSETHISEALRHPSARRSPGVLTSLKTIVAHAPTPDPRHLTAFCQRLDPGVYPDAFAAIREGSVMLGLSELPVFVSRGDKTVGVRAFGQTPPFLLIGGSHLDPKGPHFLGLAELRFAIGAELLHLRLGHTRVTTNEFWAGALTKTGNGIELVATLLPALKGWRLAHRLHHTFSKLPAGTLGQLASAANKAGATFRRSLPESDQLSPPNEQLLEATRLLQLSADRAGLLLSRDPAAAIRSILLTRREHLPLLHMLKTMSLEEALMSPPTAGSALWDLKLRVGALIGFYVSDTYERLCFELEQPTQLSARA